MIIRRSALTFNPRNISKSIVIWDCSLILLCVVLDQIRNTMDIVEWIWLNGRIIGLPNDIVVFVHAYGTGRMSNIIAEFDVCLAIAAFYISRNLLSFRILLIPITIILFCTNRTAIISQSSLNIIIQLWNHLTTNGLKWIDRWSHR